MMASARVKPYNGESRWLLLLRLAAAWVCLLAFIPGLNPARLSGLMGKTASLFTTALSYPSMGSSFVRALDRGWITQHALTVLYIGALLTGLATAALGGAVCVSLGNLKMKRLSAAVAGFASAAGMGGIGIIASVYGDFAATSNPDRIEPMLPSGLWVYTASFAVMLLIAFLTRQGLPKTMHTDRYEMDDRNRLLLMILPFLVLVALFAYLPLWGWRIAFFDYRAGYAQTADNFVGFKWLRDLFSNPATQMDIVRVLKNTFAMSGIGIATSWMPIAFAVFLSEVRSVRTKRVIQTFTTIPNFISWVLVYSIAFAIFSTEGFFNSLLKMLGSSAAGENWLMGTSGVWLKMWAWGAWKGLGWGAIIYIAAITGIDPQLYEAATVDGAGRFQKMWHVTVPGLLPTYFVMLLLSIANILTNGMDQYFVFHNHMNHDSIQVLDLYVYQLGLGAMGSSGNMPLATLVGMLKSVISVSLLLGANRVSKWIRGDGIV
jgi:putative aldouronate transport system permease protein